LNRGARDTSSSEATGRGLPGRMSVRHYDPASTPLGREASSARSPIAGIDARNRARRRGSVAIEAGLTMVLLFGLIFLILDLSMLLFVKSTLQQAVREGVRVGMTARLVGSTTYLNDSISQTVQQHALGFLNGPQGACRIQIQYFDPTTGAASMGTQGDLLVVSVNNYSYTLMGAVMKDAHPLAVSVTSSDILERCPLGGCPAALNPNPVGCT
jgi:Flp pilus assembly protein TadG